MQEVIYNHHYNPYYGGNHTSSKEIIVKINSKYWFGNLTTLLVEKALAQCGACQVNKNKTVRPPIHPILVEERNERWVMDYTMFEAGFWVLVVIDAFTKRGWARCYSTKEEDNVLQFLNELFAKHGTPKILQSDNGGEFIGKKLEKFLATKLVTKRNGRAYHPQSQGLVERFNRTLKMGIHSYIHTKQAFNLDLPAFNKVIDTVIMTYNLKGTLLYNFLNHSFHNY